MFDGGHRIRYFNRLNVCTEVVSIINLLSALYVLNGRKVTVWILFRYKKVKI